MRTFWDRAADENALYFIDNSLDYRRPDEARFWREGERELDTLLRAVGATLRPGDDVVEIGCGIGRLTRVLARRAVTVRALDVSPRMLELARRHGAGVDNVEWLLGDGASLDGIADASADAVVSHVVFQHIPDPAVTLGYVREMGRVLRPGGWAAFQVSNDPWIHRRRRGREGLRIRLAAMLGRGQGARRTRPGSARRSTSTSCAAPPPTAAWRSSGRVAREPSSASCSRAEAAPRPRPVRAPPAGRGTGRSGRGSG
jgi:SAM-dependent methyltransferase